MSAALSYRQKKRDTYGCFRKLQHLTKEAAYTARSHLMGRLHDGNKLHVYQCPHCKLWHLTRKAPE